MFGTMTKADMERICRAAAMPPVARETLDDGHEIFIADGFSLPPHWMHRHFGIEPTDFPRGAYATIWWAAKGEAGLDVGAPLYFDVGHDPSIPRESKQRARINAAIKDAKDHFARARKARLNG
jgi:hypothetical protein